MAEPYQSSIARRKVARLNEHLAKRFGLTLDLDDVEHLRRVKEHYDAKRRLLLSLHGLSESLDQEEYAKAVMISEAIAMFLREIAPTRTKPRTRKERQ